MHATTSSDNQLIEKAKAVAQHAYAPASRFRVGAALRCVDGTVYVGCNVENASYGLTICAERAAVCAAVAAGGAREIEAIAVFADTPEPVSPCGACRQVLAEFGLGMTVMMTGRDGVRLNLPLSDLLPRPFTFASIPDGEAP